jgi:methionyl-tRNA formyltransferase
MRSSITKLHNFSIFLPPSLNLVFCGTPAFAVATLKKLVESGFGVSLVVTRPDRPCGRGMEVSASAVKQSALELGLPITQPEKIKDNAEFRAGLAELKPEVIVVVGYGRILPQWMLDLPPMGNLNLHASLLPKYRGAAPIQWAIARGESVTGVTTMRIDAGLDTGDILLQKEVPIDPQDTAETLAPRLAAIGADLMVGTLRELQAGKIRPRPQDSTKATLAPILKKEDGQIDFQTTASEISNRVRGFQPWPGAFTSFRGKNLNVWSAKPAQQSAAAGELLVAGDRVIVGSGGNTGLELLEVQPQGKRRMAARDFVHGYRPRNGERLGVAS